MDSSTNSGGFDPHVDADPFKVSYTVFPDRLGESQHRIKAQPWEGFAKWIELQQTREVKSGCSMVKLATFGDRRAPTKTPGMSGSLRTDANVLHVYGIEGDHDTGTMTPADAVARLEEFGLKATICTSWSHTAEHPKWHVFTPLARPVEPARRLVYAEALNGVLGSVLAPESGNLSLSYYVGRKAGAAFEVLHTFGDPTEGECLDELDEIEAYRAPFRAKTEAANDPAGTTGTSDYLAELLNGEDVHGNALRIVGRLVREGLSDTAIKVVFAGLALGVSEARGRDRAGQLTGAELERMIDGARGKGYGPEPQTCLFTMVGDLITNLKPPAWLLKGMLEHDSLALLYGKPKTGKSFVAIDWACSIATGTPCNGMAAERAPVFYICGEGHNGLARRFIAWSIARGVSLDGAPIAVSNRAIQLTRPGAAAAVSEAVEDLRKITGADPKLIVVDTLARNFGANENDTEAMGGFIAHMDAIRAPFKATALIVHHTGKDESRGARGSGALFGAIDASYTVARDELGMVTLRPEEMKDGAVPPPQVFRMTPVVLPIEAKDGGEVTSVVLTPLAGNYTPPQRGKVGRGKNQTKALAHLTRIYEQHRERVERSGRDPDEARVLLTDWRSACLDDGIGANRWPETLASLQGAALVSVEGIYARPSE